MIWAIAKPLTLLLGIKDDMGIFCRSWCEIKSLGWSSADRFWSGQLFVLFAAELLFNDVQSSEKILVMRSYIVRSPKTAFWNNWDNHQGLTEGVGWVP